MILINLMDNSNADVGKKSIPDDSNTDTINIKILMEATLVSS